MKAALCNSSVHHFSCQTAARRHTGLRMEAEELEQLNPAIKGKRLNVVDEVSCLQADGSGFLPRRRSFSGVHQRALAWTMAKTASFQTFKMTYPPTESGACCCRMPCNMLTKTVRAMRCDAMRCHTISRHAAPPEHDRPKASGSTSSISKLPAPELSHCTTESSEKSRTNPIFPVTGRARYVPLRVS